MKFPVWPLRRFIQIFILILIFFFPVMARYSHYLSARKIDKNISRWSGSFQGELLKGTDELMRFGLPNEEGGVQGRRPRWAILHRTKNFYGSAWTVRLFGVSMTDLIAGAESFMTSRVFTPVLFMGLLIPIFATVLLGRVYCGWICPMGFLFDMGQKIRKLLSFLEIRPPAIKLWKGNKYIILVLGLIFGFFSGLPFLHYIYPPSLLGQEAHRIVSAWFDQAESGHLGIFVLNFSDIALFLIILLLIEIFASPRFFCQTICPGGALYSLLGKFRLLRVKRDIDLCTPCAKCDAICPRGLFPMEDKTGMECDNCSLCIDVCPDRALFLKASFNDLGFHSKKADEHVSS